MNPLEVLELKPGSTKEDAKKNFRRLSFLYHPDKHPNDKVAEESFKKIVNAYEQIKKDPSLLLIPNAADNLPYLYVDLEVTVEDLYFEREKNLYLKKMVTCSECDGEGTKDTEHGICDLCKGAGTIDNKFLGFLKKERTCTCPKCKGLGILKEYICEECGGHKTFQLFKTLTTKLDFKNKKYLIIKGEGHQIPRCCAGDVFIKLHLKEDPLFTIEGNCLCLSYNITPVQDLIGDVCVIEIFGKKFTFKVPVSSGVITLIDKREGLSKERKIIVRTSLSKPVLTEETRELYRKILQIEKATKSS